MKSPVSLCIIVKNEPFLEKCLQSIRDYVEEIIIVDTGSTDNTPEIAQKYADIFEVFTACNDSETGLIEDFSMARQRSFDLATKPWILWCDADDIIVGGENLIKLIEDFNKNKPQNIDGISYLFPYEYAYNAEGQCTLQHYRERLFFNKKCFHWVNPVHEVAIPYENLKIAFIPKEDLIFKHHRQHSTKIPESGRNLRILRKYYEKVGDSDARQLYYLGLECCNSGLVDESIRHLTKYIEISGWEDERVMACLKLVEIYQGQNKLEEGLKWAFKAIEIKEDWSEGYLALAKLFYFQAIKGGATETRNWQKCVYFAKAGLKLPPTKTLLFINPLDRECDIHRYLNMALNKLGDVKGALESVITGLEKQPADPVFIINKKLYEDFLARQKVVEGTNVLKQNQTIDQKAVDAVAALINNQPLTFAAEKTDSVFPVANKTTSQQDWYIPEAYDFSSLPIKMNDEQLQATVIMIWKQFMLHDEVLSAISFLENAPYSVRHSFATQKALKLTKDCLIWMSDKEDFQKVNSPGLDTEAGTPLPRELVNSAEGHRFDLMMSHMKPNSKIVDFGSMDGCFTNRYGMAGHKPVGLDGCERSVNLANKKALEFNTGAQHICTYFQDAATKVPNGSFDYATSTDTYEHLKDPVNDMLAPAKKMLKPDGKFLLATPHGAWMRGQYLEWAHPWLWAREGKNWLQPSPRAHLVAPTPWTVAEHFRSAGYWAHNSYADLCGSFRDVEGQGNIFAEAHVQAPPANSNLDIVFFIGDGVEVWTPASVKASGIGGSETAAVEMAKRLAANGNKVRVYSGCGTSGDGIYDGVEYHQTNKFQDLTCDVLIVSRRADMLADRYNIEAKLKLLWVHDVYAIGATNELLLKADRILALSEWHKQNLINHHNLHPDHIIVTRNGIDLERFNKKVARNKFKAINSGSPDRSWPVLLECWTTIKERVPEAELHLFYGFKNWEYSAPFFPGQTDLIAYLKNKIKELETLGVVNHDRVNQEQLAEEFLSAGCWIHPTWFTETSCITAMEAQAAGLRMVTSSLAALNETVSTRGVLIDGEWTSPEYKAKFVDAVVKAMTDYNEADRLQLQKYAKEHFDWNSLAREWETKFSELIVELKVNPIVPYQPTNAYK
jgi:glycosyltransferase involved in cell wall biosynthesis/2-polyprenyl-3-methyl-5-hydroxy-6-metoxy-1,4-benzoquinol methylase